MKDLLTKSLQILETEVCELDRLAHPGRMSAQIGIRKVFMRENLPIKEVVRRIETIKLSCNARRNYSTNQIDVGHALTALALDVESRTLSERKHIHLKTNHLIKYAEAKIQTKSPIINQTLYLIYGYLRYLDTMKLKISVEIRNAIFEYVDYIIQNYYGSLIPYILPSREKNGLSGISWYYYSRVLFFIIFIINWKQKNNLKINKNFTSFLNYHLAVIVKKKHRVFPEAKRYYFSSDTESASMIFDLSIFKVLNMSHQCQMTEKKLLEFNNNEMLDHSSNNVPWQCSVMRASHYLFLVDASFLVEKGEFLELQNLIEISINKEEFEDRLAQFTLSATDGYFLLSGHRYSTCLYMSQVNPNHCFSTSYPEVIYPRNILSIFEKRSYTNYKLVLYLLFDLVYFQRSPYRFLVFFCRILKSSFLIFFIRSTGFYSSEIYEVDGELCCKLRAADHSGMCRGEELGIASFSIYNDRVLHFRFSKKSVFRVVVGRIITADGLRVRLGRFNILLWNSAIKFDV